VSLAGFVIVGAALFAGGESLLTAAFWAIAAFFALWVAQGVIHAILGLATVTGPRSSESEVDET
jgi:hypothetical protein